MLLKLAAKNIFSRKSSFVIVIFISFALAILVAANSVFDSTENGIQSSFIDSFTGDAFVRVKTDSSVSLFGDDTPLLGKLSRVSAIENYQEVSSEILKIEGVGGLVPQLSGIGEIESDSGEDFKIVFFGIPGTTYESFMPALKLTEGKPFADENRGAMLSVSHAEKLNVAVGDTVQITVADGPVQRIRAVTVTGIYDYDLPNPVFDRYVLIDQHTARALLDLHAPVESDEIHLDEDEKQLLNDDFDLDSLFSDENDEVISESSLSDISSQAAEAVSSEEFEKFKESEKEGDDWHFIIVRAASGTSGTSLVNRLNSYFKKNSLNLEALNWRSAAGSSAIYLFWLRIIFNIGIFVVLIAGFIIINNTLVVNVLDRTREIGTMRAIGATKVFISLECMAETLILALISGVIGTVLGALLSYGIDAAKIPLNNDFLVQLFGGERIITVINGTSVARSVLMVLILGMAGWIYPMKAALSVNPVTAMQGGK